MALQELSELEKVSGIGTSTLENFRLAGYDTLEDLKGVSRSELMSIPGIGGSTADNILVFLDQAGLRVEEDRRQQNVEKLQDLLREMFYLDSPDLNHGVHRIINQRRERIDTFVTDELPEVVGEGLDILAAEQAEDIQQEFEEVCEEIQESIGNQYIGKNGELTQELPDIPVAEKLESRHQELQEQLEAAESRDELETEVFNSLFKFFNRYFTDGDFSPRLRSSNQTSYAIPYNGEEVTLYWANKDQYFVKETDLLQDYSYDVEDVEVEFIVDNSRIYQANNKDESRYYLLAPDDPIYIDDGYVQIRFEYRPLEDEDYESYDVSQRGRSKQETVREVINDRVLEKASSELEEVLSEPDEEGAEPLLWHLEQFTTKNKRDYFIHKDLQGFLDREREQFVRNEVLHDRALEANNYQLSVEQRAQIKAFNNVAGEIISFLGQLEDFQRDLYEKKKFVLDSDYLITIDHLDEGLYSEILDNDAQLEAWKDLYSIEETANEGLGRYTESSINEEYLQSNQYLMIDTQYFDTSTTIEMLDSLGNLEEEIDGRLIKGDNLHALDLLENKYAQSIDCVYVDPPYNTGNDEFVYKDNFKHSSWLSMMSDRIDRTHTLLADDGAFFSSIDDNEVHRLNELLRDTFGEENEAAPIVVRSNPRGRTLDQYIAKTHEYVLSFVKDRNVTDAIQEVEKSGDAIKQYNREDERGKYRRLGLRNRNPQFTRENRPNLFFPIYIDSENKTVSLDQNEQHSIEVYPRDSEGNDDCWRWGEEKVSEESHMLEAHQTRSGDWRVSIKDYLRDENGEMATTMRKSLWTDNSYNNQHGKQELKSMMGEHTVDFPKSVNLIRDITEIGCPKDGTVLDFFAGSGTTGQAVLELNRDDGGDRNYILVEMGEYFDTVLKPRIQKYVYSDDWEDGTPTTEGEGMSQVVEYMSLETYDDSLNNIELQESRQTTLRDSRGYLLRYLLRNEAEGSNALLDVDSLESPFSYELDVRKEGTQHFQEIDLVTTFNYLLGIDVRTYQYDETEEYLLVEGRDGADSIIIIWRDLTDVSTDRDVDIINDMIKNEYDRLYVNSGTAHPDAESLDALFKNRMWNA